MATPPLLALAGLLNIDLVRVGKDLKTVPKPVWLVLAFAAWAAASSLWSGYHNHSQALRLWGTLGPGLLFVLAAQRNESSRRWTRAASLAAICVMIALLWGEATLNMPINRAFDHVLATWQIERNPGRGVSILLAVIWASAGALFTKGRVHSWFAIVLLLAVGALSPQFEDYSNLVAFLAGFLAFGLGAWLPRVATLFVTWSLGVWLLTAPLLTPILTANQRMVDMLPYTWAARIGVWRYVCTRIIEHPIFGSGLDASHTVTDTIVIRANTIRAVPLHPHSVSLHIWFDAGAIGAALAAAALFWGGWVIASRVAGRRAYAAAVCGTFAAIGAIANVSYGAWQEWWDATILIAAALLLTMAPKTRTVT